MIHAWEVQKPWEEFSGKRLNQYYSNTSRFLMLTVHCQLAEVEKCYFNLIYTEVHETLL